MPTAYDTLLITTPENVRYRTGFAGGGVALVRGRKTVLLTDPRYTELARQTAHRGVSLQIFQSDFATTLQTVLQKLGTQKLGFEAAHVTVASHAAYQKIARKAGVKLVATEEVIETARRVKSPTEQAQIARACALTTRILQAVVRGLRVGQTELSVAAEFAARAAAAGAEGMAFETIVAFGGHAATPHHHPTPRRLKKGDVVLIDCGVKLAGYCADCTRTFFTAPPRPAQKTAYAAVLAAQLAGVQKVRAGVAAAAVDSAAREQLAAVNLAEFFTHSTGHGLGLNVHEWPNLAPRSRDTLPAGSLVTVEPGVYLPAQNFGVRIEDTVLVTPTGGQILTLAPKKLTVLAV